MTPLNIIKTYTKVYYAIVLENVIHRGSDPIFPQHKRKNNLNSCSVNESDYDMNFDQVNSIIF